MEKSYVLAQGDRFGRLTVIERDYQKSNHDTWWRCKCDCGNILSVRTSHLIHGKTKSCGCIRIERIVSLNKKHGQSGKSIHNVWMTIIARCDNPRSSIYERYGGRSITYCKEWAEFSVFYEWALANGYKEGLTLDRINNDGNYEPNNCRWVDMKAQSRNRSNTLYVDFRGERASLSEFCERMGMPYNQVRQRIKKLNWSVENALTIPIRGRKHGNT